MKIYYMNKNTGKVITEREYDALIEREILNLWDDEDKEEWESFEEFRQHFLDEDIDQDYFIVNKNGKPITE